MVGLALSGHLSYSPPSIGLAMLRAVPHRAPSGEAKQTPRSQELGVRA